MLLQELLLVLVLLLRVRLLLSSTSLMRDRANKTAKNEGGKKVSMFVFDMKAATGIHLKMSQSIGRTGTIKS